MPPVETATSAAALAAARCDVLAPGAGALTTIAEDRLEGAKAIARFIDMNMTEREMRLRLERGDYPCWREGRVYVASKAALLAHWREMTARRSGAQQSQPGTPQHTSTRRGYRPRARA